ncbi:DUF898 domain-containing protein [Mycolicibacter virginiensis]|uniref:DUF898 domain-containing protein n=1 Tax=Mycolicibacter virginiensis TaxID=1795032 RepID=A0A9X7NWW9_9MYCO|nr:MULTISPECIES: DUF898 family protein [Mycobacteriaceae]PQM50334.1 DUF898 domain-containing protein [Mycolicibacter virginiensis]
MSTPYLPEPHPPGPIPAGPPNLGPAPQPTAPPVVPKRAQTHQFAFDGGAGTYLGTAVLAFLITVLTLGICYPFGLVLRERWRAKHSYIEGRQLAFTGSAWGLFGMWWKWLILIIITVGIYGFWVGPRLARWKWENTSWAQHTPV